MGDSDQGPSLIDELRELFGKFNEALVSNLDRYGYSSLHGYFVGISLLSSFSVAVAYSYNQVSNGFNFGADLVIFTILAAIVMFPLFSYGLVHVYHAFFRTVGATRKALSWQVLAFFISILLTFVLKSAAAVGGGFVVFGTLLFVHPLLKVLYGGRVSDNDFNSTLNKVYLVVFALANLIQVILKFIGIM